MNTPKLFSFVSHLYHTPLLIDHAKGCTIHDNNGREYLDAYAGVASVSVGHSHPRIIERVKSQVELVHHTSMLYQTRPMNDYLSEIQNVLPSRLCRHFFVNSGSEAVDFAIQATRAHRNRAVVISMSEGYHGGSYTTKSITGLEAWQPIFAPDKPVIFHPVCSCRKCHQSGWNPYMKRLKPLSMTCDASCLDGLFITLQERGSSIAGLFIEPILGVGGILVPTLGFFSRIAALCQEFEIDLICDEVQTGFGRCGKSLFGFERFRINPDIICMAKGIANGFPMGLVSATEEISESMASKLHFSTFGGNPVSCVAASETLKVIQEEGIAENAYRIGEYLLERLEQRFINLSECIEIRGLGLMIGVEFSETVSAIQIIENCYRKGLLLGIGGRKRNVIRIEPPLIFSKNDAEKTVDILDIAVKEVLQK